MTTIIFAIFLALAIQVWTIISVFGKPVWNSRTANDWLNLYESKLYKVTIIWTCVETRGYIGTMPLSH